MDFNGPLGLINFFGAKSLDTNLLVKLFKLICLLKTRILLDFTKNRQNFSIIFIRFNCF